MMHSHAIYKLIVIAALLLAVTGCKKGDETKPSGAAQTNSPARSERIVNIKAGTAELRAIQPYISATGTLKANEEVTVSAEVSGPLKAVHADEGTVVTKGMLLAEIDDTDFSLELRRAEAAVRQSEATLDNNTTEKSRKEALLKDNLITRQQFDDVQTRYALSVAELDRARAALAIAKQKVTKTRVFSPLSGTVREKRVSTGDYVREATPLFSVIQYNPIKLIFSVTERDMASVKKSGAVTVKVDAYPDRAFRGKVNVIYPALDEKTRTLMVEAILENSGGLLKPGLFAEVTLSTEDKRNAVLVPATAIMYEADKVKIFVIEGDKARERFINIGNKYADAVEVVDGIKAGEMLAVVGQQSLSEGVRVNASR